MSLRPCKAGQQSTKLELYIAKEFKQLHHEEKINHLFAVINSPLLLISK
jgi:hypothetical protein